jgi:hypothetical protein
MSEAGFALVILAGAALCDCRSREFNSIALGRANIGDTKENVSARIKNVRFTLTPGFRLAIR